MVTVITNKLKKQSLEDLPNEPLKVGTIAVDSKDFLRQKTLLEGDFRQRVYHDRRQGPGHSRTRSYPTHNLRGSTDCQERFFNSSSFHSTTTPPASKKLCRSISVPEEEATNENILSCWVPKASKVWHPVKIHSKSCLRPRSISSPPEKVLQVKNTIIAETQISPNTCVNSITTPPASPTPRPASAFASLSQNLCTKACLKEEEKTPTCSAVESITNECPRLKRSRSQPCFEQVRVCGVKRRIEDDFDRSNNLRPALDLAKMEESSYFRFRDKRRGLRIPKYSNKTEPKLPAPYFTEHESFILKPIVSSPLDATASSIMITPTSSPTKQLDKADRFTSEKIIANTLQDEKRKPKDIKIKDIEVYNLDYGLELDIASIEEDDFY